MASSLLSRRSVAGITGLLLLVVPACTGRASPGPVRTSGGAPPASTAGPASPSGSPTSSPTPSTADAVRVRAPSTGSLLLRGSYPRTPSRCVRHEQPRLLARYPGTLAVARSDDGTLSLTVTLPFERYLEGIAEVPPSWPMAALEAQAIAARSYALASTGWSGAEGQTLERPICATTSCQVYAGIPVPPEPGVARWYRAVRQTAGEVLLYQGRPAQTVYFSTSNGRTYGNDQVWGSAPLPYLRSVPEHDDGASPTSHWRVRLPFPDLARFLRTAGEWPKDRAITGVRLEGSSVVVSGPGTSRSIDVGTFRSAVDTWAPCLEPERYPPSSLPVTIPSSWLQIASDGSAAVITGRGWGHGVGMVQWGAYGKAQRGWSASQILAYYYGGLRPQPFPEPGLIHVRVASGLTSVRLVPSKAGATLDGEAIGSGTVTITGGDRLSVSTST